MIVYLSIKLIEIFFSQRPPTFMDNLHALFCINLSRFLSFYQEEEEKKNSSMIKIVCNGQMFSSLSSSYTLQRFIDEAKKERVMIFSRQASIYWAS